MELSNRAFRFFVPIGCAALVALGFSGTANALPVLFCKDGPAINLVTQGCISGTAPGYPGGGDGIFSNAGGGDPEAAVEAAILGATGTTVDIMLFGKSDDAGEPGTKFTFTPDEGLATLLTDSQSGTWTSTMAVSYITIKAANSFALFEFNPATSSGLYSTAGILNNGGNQPTVSHTSFWKVGNGAAPVPEPGTLLFIGSGLVGLGAGAGRRKKQ